MQNPEQEQASDFIEAMQDVKPLKQDDKVHAHKAKSTLAQKLKRQALEKIERQDGNQLSIEKVSPVDPLDVLEFKKDGIQDGVYKNLRLGKYKVDTFLNLQGMKVDLARETIYESIVSAHQSGARTLLIKHGIGQNSKPFPALLKSYVNQWLRQMPQVIAFHSALRQQGGLGSVYVLLKKNRQDKDTNRELHRRK